MEGVPAVERRTLCCCCDRVFDIDGLAEYLHLSPSTVRNLIHAYAIPYVQLSVRRYIFSKRRIDDWLYDISTTPIARDTENDPDSRVSEILSSIRR